MFLISTRNFPPDVGGIQNLMEGLSNALLNHGPVKVFADNFENSERGAFNISPGLTTNTIYEPTVEIKNCAIAN